MADMTATQKPGPGTTVAIMCRRGVLVTALMRAAEKALELGGGAGFYRNAGLERCFRDVQAARYHPMPEKPQAQLTGRYLFGLDLD